MKQPTRSLLSSAHRSANQANATLLASDAIAILDVIQPCIWYIQITDWFYWLVTGLETLVNTCWL